VAREKQLPMRILVFADWFEPAFKAGGPVQSAINLVQFLRQNHEVFVFTSDRDLHDTFPLKGICVGEWQQRCGIQVYYHAPGKMTFRVVKSVIDKINPDRIYLNSMFSNMFIPLWVAFQSGKIILAPRGMLKPSALSHKPLKKYLYCSLLRVLGIERYICFHAADTVEIAEIRKIFPNAGKVIAAPNIPVAISTDLPILHKQSGRLNMAFVARLHPIKNLDFLLKLLHTAAGFIELHVAIVREDLAYLDTCMQLAEKLPANITVKWHVELPPASILDLLKTTQVFVLPSKGESFGHAIFEALSVGCPVLISDQTPWKNLLDRKAGMELSLETDAFKEGLDHFIALDDQAWQQFRQGALRLARDYVSGMDLEKKYNLLLGIYAS
jgi:glycosyltransferase involved in cell wall biosynthesis